MFVIVIIAVYLNVCDCGLNDVYISQLIFTLSYGFFICVAVNKGLMCYEKNFAFKV